MSQPSTHVRMARISSGPLSASQSDTRRSLEVGRVLEVPVKNGQPLLVVAHPDVDFHDVGPSWTLRKSSIEIGTGIQIVLTR